MHGNNEWFKHPYTISPNFCFPHLLPKRSFNIISNRPHQPYLIFHPSAVRQYAVFANLKIYILQDLCSVDSFLSFLLMPSGCMQFGGFA